MNCQPRIPMKGLQLVTGHSREEIQQVLEPSGFRFVFHEDRCGAYYFRETKVAARGPYEQVRASIVNALGMPTSERVVRGWGAKPVLSYHALWHMTPEFDQKLLDGPITFREGDLVERTFFYFADR